MIHPFEGILVPEDGGTPSEHTAAGRPVTRRQFLVRSAAAGCGLGVAGTASVADGQATTQAVGEEGGGGGGGGGGTGGAAGVVVEADGVLQRSTVVDRSGDLQRRRLAAAQAAKSHRQQASDLRKVSLNRLEAALSERVDAGKQPEEDMLSLAGLTRLKYAFCLPESKDVVIAGPAEPFFLDADGVTRAIESLRPTLRLPHLLVALRAFPRGARPTPQIGCSIDPTPEGLTRMQQFLNGVARGGPPPHPRVIVQGLQQSLGRHKATVTGVPNTSEFALFLLAADYRMKLVAIGLEQLPVKVTTYIDAARAGSSNALVRWYFTPDYDSVRVSEDKLAMELVGNGVKLVGEDELVGPDGVRRGGGRSDRASQLFTRSFTEKFPQIAAKISVFAQLRNLIDLVIAAAYVQQQDFFGRVGWSMSLFGSERRLPVQTLNAPTTAATAINAVMKGNRLFTPVGGGVEIYPARALSSAAVMDDKAGKLGGHVAVDGLQPGQWWWD